MKSLLKSKRGLSTVVTTLIILVVSVLLATVVTFYAINVTTTRVQEESIHLTKLHFWHNGTTFSECALLIINSGGRDFVLDKIAVRGQQSAWDTVYYNKTQTAISPDLTYVTPNPTGNLTGKSVTLGSTTYPLSQGTAGNDMILKSGWSMICYITDPDSLGVNDIGVTLGITIFTANAQYYKEANVEASA
jgi:hypothetical protein